LHAEQSAVFVAVFDLNLFKDFMELVFKIYVTFEIKETALQLFAGALRLRPDEFFQENCDLWEAMFVYRNLLTVTATSTKLRLLVKYKIEPRKSLTNFLEITLQFQQIHGKKNEDSSLFQDSQVFYCNRGNSLNFYIKI
jgi:hypothetical protein